MNGRTLILMVVAIAIAMATVVVVKNRAGGGEGGPKILVAADDIPAGAFLRADKDLAWIDLPQSTLSPSYITSDAHQLEEFNGAVARRSIAAGELITTTEIMRAKEGGFMSAVLTPGLRAVSIGVSPTSGNAGFVFPGDKVDLLLTHKIPVKENNDSELASETFIENVRVLAIDQMLDNPENKAVVAKTITLEVSPKQAEMINVATNLGSISISLRSLATGNAAPAGQTPGVSALTPVKPLNAGVASGSIISPAPPEHVGSPGIQYSTDSDVSKLMGDRNPVRSKVSVYHGSTAEQIDFHQGAK